MNKYQQRKNAILARYNAAISEKEAAVAERTSLREQLTEKARQLAEANTLAERFQALAEMTHWAELPSGASVNAGDRVRYLLRTFECVKAHTKALTRSPLDSAYWQEVSEP